MNGIERAQLAFNHQEADRVPVFELTIDNPTAEYVLGRPNYCGFGGKARGYEQNKAILEGRFHEYHAQRTADLIELWKKLDLDVFPDIFPVPVNPTAPEIIAENTYRFTDHELNQFVICRYIPDVDIYDIVDSTLRQGGLAELEKLTEHLEKTEPKLSDWDFTPVKTALQELGSDVMIMSGCDVEIGSTYDWAETFLVGLIEAPDLIHRYLDARLKTSLMLTEEMLKLGIHGVHGGWDWAGSKGPVFSPRHFRKFVFPRLKQITDLCHKYGVPYIKHTDGNVMSLLDDMIDAGVDAFQAIEPRAGMDIGAIKQKYGDRLTLIGNVDCSTVLVDGPVDAVRKQTEEVIRAAAPGGGFLLSSSNSIHPGVKPEYYLAMLDTARKVGQYPIS